MPNPNFDHDEDFDDEDDYFDDEDYYDSQGNSTPGGLYDAGGHLIGERWAAYADDLRDRIRDEAF